MIFIIFNGSITAFFPGQEPYGGHSWRLFLKMLFIISLQPHLAAGASMRPILPFFLLLGLFPACGDNGSSDDATDGTTGAATDGPTTDTPTTTGEGDLNERELGASATPACVAARSHLTALFTAAAAGDAAAASAAYTGSPLQTYVKQLDVLGERTDDTDISAWLTDGGAPALVAAAARVQVAYARHFRDNLTAVETGTPDGFAAWDEAHCLWEAGLRPLAIEADAVTWHSVDETITADIDAALGDGHDGIGGEPPNTTIDDWRIPPNKQRAEKSLFRAAQRVIVELAGAARADADPIAARRALELFGLVEDRLDGRNTPGIQQIKDILGGDPAMIDPLVILDELDIAFAKRTRNYADQAIVDAEVGVPAGYKGAVEGNTYALLLVPGMIARLGGAFIPAAYVGEWAGYADLVRSGDDADTLAKVSQRLVDQTCSYQTALGIAACTGEDDETE